MMRRTAAAAAVALGVLGGVGGLTGAAPATAAAKQKSFATYYVLPKNAHAVDRTAAIRQDLAAVNGWYRAQTGGKQPRFVRAKGKITVRTVHLSVTSAKLKAKGSDSLGYVQKALAKAGVAAKAMVVAYVEGASSTGECGVDGGYAAVLWMRGCGGIYPSTDDTFPYGATYLAAHEMTHAMGAVRGCAPHSTGDGHVKDSPSDILYEGPKQRTWSHLVLDYHHDDYYRNKGRCTGITKNPVWTTSAS